MASKVEMTLDDIIKKTKIGARGRGRGRGAVRGQAKGQATRGKGQGTRGGGVQQARGRGRGGVGTLRGGVRGRGQYFNRGRGAGATRGASQTRGRGAGRGGQRGSFNNSFSFGGQQVVRQVQIQTGPVKASITNLDFGVTDNDINELFSEFGKLKSAAVHYDRTGRSLATAHVVFDRRADAIKAIKQYNGVMLDGRPMRITIEGDKPQAMAVGGATRGTFQPRGTFRGTTRGSFRGSAGAVRGSFRGNRGASRGTFTPRGGATRGSFRGRGGAARGGATRGTFKPRGGAKQVRGGVRGRGNRGGRGGRGRGGKPPTLDQLNKELDAYVTEASS